MNLLLRRPGRGADRYCDECVRLSVCQHAHLRNRTYELLSMLPVAAARSFSGRVLIRYVIQFFCG